MPTPIRGTSSTTPNQPLNNDKQPARPGPSGGTTPAPSGGILDELRKRSDTVSLQNRQEYKSPLASLPKHNPYGELVQGVGGYLEKSKVGITKPTADSIAKNVAATNEGKMTQTAAHVSEVKNFGADALAHTVAGRPKDAAWSFTGVVANTVATLGSGAVDHQKQRQKDPSSYFEDNSGMPPH